MTPVAIRAPFCVRESFSAGRLRSEIPAMTRPHYRRHKSSQFFFFFCFWPGSPVTIAHPIIPRESHPTPIIRFLSQRTFITGALPTSRTISHCCTQNTFNYIQHNKTHQKCTVFTPTGLFHRRWKTLCGCDSAAAAPASELWKRKPGRRKGPVALRNAAREFWKKRRPMRDVGILVDWLYALIRCWGGGK